MTRFLFALVCVANLPAQTTPPVTIAPSGASPAASIRYAPPLLVGLGGGFLVPSGGGALAYQQVSGYLGSGTYASTVNEYTLVKGALQNCALAGASVVKYQPGPFSFGATGLAGGCEGTTGNAAAAGSAQVFGSWHIGKTALSLIVTGRKTWTASGKQAAKLTLGVIYGWGK